MAADIRTYRSMLRVNKNKLDDEFEVHAQVMDDICDVLTRLEGMEETLKNELKLVEARVFADFKDRGEKTTDKEADTHVLRSRERKAAWEALLQVSLERREWDRLLQAWKAKEVSLRGLAGLFTSQYFVITSHVDRERPSRYRSEEAARRERPAYTGGINRNETAPTSQARRRINT